jgi:syntaxin-binding protein 5
VKGIMEQNRAMLAERGERLQNLDERTAAMSEDAGDFASMAKQLADMQANRKWWQF